MWYAGELNMPKYRRFIFLTLAFTGGSCVMAAELLGAGLTAPYFGTSLYVWSSDISLEWRKSYNNHFTRQFVNEGLSIFQ